MVHGGPSCGVTPSSLEIDASNCTQKTGCDMVRMVGQEMSPAGGGAVQALPVKIICGYAQIILV